MPQIEFITTFVKICANDENKSEELYKVLIGLIGDLGQAFGSKLIGFLSDSLIIKLLQEAMSPEYEKTEINSTARWTQQVCSCSYYH